jgi:hypothetical protein
MSALTELLRELEAQGFTWRTTKRNHILIYAPQGHVVTTLPSTPSDHRSMKNAIAGLRRAGFEWKGR